MNDEEIKYKNELINKYVNLSKEERSTWALCVDTKGGRYHQSMDWIVPVIEKIKSERNRVEFAASYDLYGCTIISNKNGNSGQPFIFSSNSSVMLTCMYECVLDYIQGFSQMPYSLHGANISEESTSLMGYIDVSYDELVKKFGCPNRGDGYKVDAEWEIQFKDKNRSLAYIYNYKDGKNYLGESGMNVTDIRDWHIGGARKDVVSYIKKLLKIK